MRGGITTPSSLMTPKTVTVSGYFVFITFGTSAGFIAIHCTVCEKGPNRSKNHYYRSDWLNELNITRYYLLHTRANFIKIWKKYFNVFGLIRPKNGIECLRKYSKMPSNQNVREAKVVLLSKKIVFDKWENIFSEVFELIRSKNGIEYLRKYPKTAFNRKVP